MHGPLLVVAGFAVVATLIAWARLLAGRRWAAVGHFAMAVAAASLFAAAWPVARHLSSYERTVRGEAVAEIYFERAGVRRYRATLTRLPAGRMQVFDLAGDEWRLVARSLEWSPRAGELGLRPLYRLERLVARASGIGPGGTDAPPVEFDLFERRGVDPWSGTRPGRLWSAAARATTLEGPWQPMVEGRRFEVRLQGDALVVRARGTAGEHAPRSR